MDKIRCEGFVVTIDTNQCTVEELDFLKGMMTEYLAEVTRRVEIAKSPEKLAELLAEVGTVCCGHCGGPTNHPNTEYCKGAWCDKCLEESYKT